MEKIDLEKLEKLDKSNAINQYSKVNQTKKTNCPFRLKFIKKQELIYPGTRNVR